MEFDIMVNLLGLLFVIFLESTYFRKVTSFGAITLQNLRKGLICKRVR